MRLTTNDFAVLGLLAARAWSPYELAQFMSSRSNLRLFWPQAVSHIYAIPKRLAKGGYATAKAEGPSTRPRTVYRISAKGRAALRTWLKEPVLDWPVVSEVILKISSANEVDIADLREMLLNVRRGRAEAAEAWVKEIDGLLAKGFVLPDRAHLQPIGVELSNRIFQAVIDWSRWAEDYVAAWSDTRADPAKIARAQDYLRALRDRIEGDLAPAPMRQSMTQAGAARRKRYKG